MAVLDTKIAKREEKENDCWVTMNVRLRKVKNKKLKKLTDDKGGCKKWVKKNSTSMFFFQGVVQLKMIVESTHGRGLSPLRLLHFNMQTG